jgi:hypothetical protein
MAVGTTTALLLAAAAAGASAYNTQQTAKRQDSAAAEGIRRQSENQRRATANVNKTVEQVGKSSAEPDRMQAREQFLTAIRQRSAQARQGLGPTGLSSAYDQLAGSEAANAEQYALGQAGNLATIEGATRQRQREGNAFGDLGMNLDAMSGDVRGDQFLTDLRVRGIRRNPWIDAASAAAGGIAGGYGGGGGG